MIAKRKDRGLHPKMLKDKAEKLLDFTNIFSNKQLNISVMQKTFYHKK
jgi:hypothetical protein